VVVPELFQSLNPVAYSGRMDAEAAAPQATALAAPAGAPPPPAAGFGGFGRRSGAEAKKADRGGWANGKDGGSEGSARLALQLNEQLAARMNLGGSVAAAASAAKLGDYFQYAIDRPVTLPRQKSALLPIVGKDVQASRVSIYNEGVQAKFPLLGLRFKNSAGLHLMQGPITVFEGSNYAGDA